MKPYEIKSGGTSFSVAPVQSVTKLTGEVAIWNTDKAGDTVHVSAAQATAFAEAILRAVRKATSK